MQTPSMATALGGGPAGRVFLAFFKAMCRFLGSRPGAIPRRNVCTAQKILDSRSNASKT
jgi:hypothetical protein